MITVIITCYRALEENGTNPLDRCARLFPTRVHRAEYYDEISDNNNIIFFIIQYARIDLNN